jgi:sigma-B regulation protein RsbU (phosphoserine phosphatase)
MKSECGAGPLTFKICMALGFLLGIALLGQSISTYIDVSGTVTSQVSARSRDFRPAARTLVDTHPSSNSFPRAMRMELTAYLGSVADSIESLRRNLIVEVSASLALSGALLVLMLRFPKYVRGQQVQGQVNLARQVQADLLPPRDLESPHFEFAAECIPAGDVGGDFCDVFRVGGDRTALVLGDVSGKGVSAALLMALIHGAIHSMCWTRSAADHENATQSLNTLLCKKTAAERFSTMFWGYYDPNTSVLRYINAGHLPPLLIRTGEFGNLEVERLESGGPVLGVLPDTRYTQGQLAVRKGDLLVAFSDGILETANLAGDEFGENRLIDAIRTGWKDSAGSIRNIVLERVTAFANQQSAHDDRTLFAVRFKHAAGHPALFAAPGEKRCLVAL